MIMTDAMSAAVMVMTTTSMTMANLYARVMIARSMESTMRMIKV